MHQATRDAVVAWWEQRSERAAGAGARRPVPSREWPRFTPGAREHVRLCTWGSTTYVAVRADVPVPEDLHANRGWVGANHEWVVYRASGEVPMRKWRTTPSLTFVLASIARTT